MAASPPKLPPVDQEVTSEELLRLVERLGHDPDKVSQLTIRSSATGKTMTVAVRYLQLVRPVGKVGS